MRLASFRASGQAGFVTHHFGRGVSYKYHIYPSFNPLENANGQSFIHWLRRLNPDFVFTPGDLNWFKPCIDAELDNWLAYLAIDSSPLSAWEEDLKRIPYIVTPTKWAFKELLKMGIRPLGVIEHGIDLRFFPFLNRSQKAKMKKKMGFDSDTVIIGGIGLNQFRKRWDLWINIFREISDSIPGVKGLLHVPIHGEFPIADLLYSSGIKEKVMMPIRDVTPITKVPFKDLWKSYALMDILIHPSGCGAFEYPIMEAQASGVKVVCNDYAGMSETAIDEYKVKPEKFNWSPGATLHAEADVRGFSSRANEFILMGDDDSLERRGRERAELHDWSKVNPKWVSLFDKLIGHLPEKTQREFTSLMGDE